MIDDQEHVLVIRYAHDDERLRRDFDRRLALYLRAHQGQTRWDITPLVDTLDQLGRKIPHMLVRLRCRPQKGELRASIEFDLTAIPAPAQDRPAPH